MGIKALAWTASAIAVLAGVAGAVASCGGDDGTTGGFPLDGGSGGRDEQGNVIDTDGSVITTPDGGSSACSPKTCQQLGFDCGDNADGCGGVLQCGVCNAPDVCGGGGFSKCGNNGFAPDGAVACVPTTCAQLAINCGPAGDGCGGVLQCGTCVLPDICGGGGKPSICGNSVPCNGLCKQQVTCDGGGTTTLKGKVVAGTLPKYLPNNAVPDPVPNVLVYVPNAPVLAFSKGVQCSQCGADVSGSPLVQATTDVDGTFTLTNVPVGNNIPVVIQLGRWRRQVTFNVPGCVTTAIGDIHMPRNKSEGDIPLTAISTGSVDGFECVLLKMGVDQAEFTNPAGGGRIETYLGNGARISNQTPAESTLTAKLATLESYDQVFFPCWGGQIAKPAATQQNVVDYTDNGGRVFATHFSYTWLYNIAPFSQTATWNANAGSLVSTSAEIDTSFNKGQTFAKWLGIVGALTQQNPARMNISDPRHDFDAVVSPAVRTMYTVGQNPNFPLNYSFDTPWGKQNQCGRVVYSDFHVAGTNSGGQTFPAECTASPMTAQEKALEFMIWDLASCVPPPPKPLCTPLTCAQQNISCGPAGDGCGGLLQCGNCVSPQTCGGGGKSGQCGAPDGGPCAPKTCAQLGFDCGPAGDGCGGLIQCGTCNAPDTCGGGGNGGVCGNSAPH